MAGYLAYIGRHSLDVYIFHYFFLQVLNMFSFGSWVAETGNYLIEGLVIIPLTVVITYLSIGVGWLLRQSGVLRLVVFGER